METTILWALVAGSALLWFVLRKRAEEMEPDELPTQEASEFHCVEVMACGPACHAVKRIEGRRFLADEAPTLPLSGCTLHGGACNTCIYVHHADRRHHRRRDVVVDLNYDGRERRQGAAPRSGRRLVDRLQVAQAVTVSYDARH